VFADPVIPLTEDEQEMMNIMGFAAFNTTKARLLFDILSIKNNLPMKRNLIKSKFG